MSTTTLDYNGTKIVVPHMPYKLRCNNKAGMFGDGNLNTFDEMKVNGRGNWMEVAIIDTIDFHGDLGMTKGANWKQVWFVVTKADTSVDKPLRPGLVCVTYLKKESVDIYSKVSVNLNMDAQFDGADIVNKIYRFEFFKRTNEFGDSFPMKTTYRDAETEAERAYCQAAVDIRDQAQQVLVDDETTKLMVKKEVSESPLLNGSFIPALAPAADTKVIAGAKGK